MQSEASKTAGSTVLSHGDVCEFTRKGGNSAPPPQLGLFLKLELPFMPSLESLARS